MADKQSLNSNNSTTELNDDPSQWTAEDVLKWLKQNGYKELQANLANSASPVTGQVLLTLSRDQLVQPPFYMINLDDVDHLYSSIESLRKQQLKKYMKKELQNGLHSVSRHSLTSNGSITNRIVDQSQGDYVTVALRDDNELSSLVPERGSISSEQCHPELFKTFVAAAYMLFCCAISVFMLQVVHERVPPVSKEPPLPDIFFDVVPKRVEGAFVVCEWIGIVQSGFCIAICVFHKYRFVIFRRICFILGTLYLYRTITIYVTTLPVPGLHFNCAPKVNYHLSTMIARAAGVLSGGGLTVTGAHQYCGDYLFSGHTVILVMTYMVICEYTPKRWWALHWLSWTLAAVAIVCILLAHDHYTIDVLIAYLLVTRLFWTYHTMCSVTVLKSRSKSNFIARAWWYPLFLYFEENVPSNGPLPRQYTWPLPWPKRIRQLFEQRSSLIKGV